MILNAKLYYFKSLSYFILEQLLLKQNKINPANFYLDYKVKIWHSGKN